MPGSLEAAIRRTQDRKTGALLSGYASPMPDSFLPTGKLPVRLLAELLHSDEPIPREVLLGPSIGEDAAAIQLASGTLVAATDPITLTGEGVGRYAVIVNANDIAVMGVRPRWFLCAAMLPPGTTETEVRALFAEVREELALLDATLVGGHTEVTSGRESARRRGAVSGPFGRRQLRENKRALNWRPDRPGWPVSDRRCRNPGRQLS